MLVTTTAFLSKTVAFYSSSPSQRVGHQTTLCVPQAPPPAVSSRTRVATTTTQCHLPFLRLSAQQCLACAGKHTQPCLPSLSSRKPRVPSLGAAPVWHHLHLANSPCGPSIELLCCPFPCDKGSGYRVIDWFHADRWALPGSHRNPWLYGLIVASEGIGLHQRPPSTQSPLPGLWMVINGVSLSNNESNPVGLPVQTQDLCLFIFDVIVLLSSQNSWDFICLL